MRYLSKEELVAMAWTTTIVALLFTFGRFLIHYRNRKRLGWDDIFNGIAAIFLLAFIGTWQSFVPTEYQAQLYSMGLSDAKPVVHKELFQKFNLANAILFWCCIYSVKASFLALYWSIFEVSSGFRIAWVLSSVYIGASFVATILVRIWVCGHPKDVFNQNKCKNIGRSGVMKMQVPWCVLDGLGDIILMILPIMMIRGMFLRRARKIQIGILFGLVGLNLITNILRTIYTIIRDLKRFPQLNAAWVFLQITTAVIICSLPCYGSLFSRKKQTTPEITYGAGYTGSKFSKQSNSLKESDSLRSVNEQGQIGRLQITKVECTTMY